MAAQVIAGALFSYSEKADERPRGVKRASHLLVSRRTFYPTLLGNLQAAPHIPATSHGIEKQGNEVTMYTILLIVLILLLIGALPTWPYSGGWGYYPSGGLGVILLIILVLMLLGRA